MDLINYLNEHYYSKQQLLALTKISHEELLSWQQQKVMPSCSYKIALNYACDSFFGECKQQSEIEYYAKGYLSWIGILKGSKDTQNIFNIFAQRYKNSLDALKVRNNMMLIGQ